jgi:hypothetical protein
VLRPEVLKKFDQKARARGIRVLYYGATSCVADHNPTTELYRKFWANNFSASFASFGMNDINTPYRDAWPVPYRLMAACPGNRSFNEFMIYYADKALRETGISGLYTDTDGVVACDNLTDGHGFTDANLTGGFMRPDLMGDWWDLLVRMKVVESQFIGYWESGCPVKAQTAKALASVYKNADFVAVPVTNRQVEAIPVTVNIDLKALGLDGKKLKLTDERTRRPVELKDGTFTIPLSGRNFTFVSLRTQ